MISALIRSIIGNEELVKKLLKDEKISQSIAKIAGSEESEKFLEKVLEDEGVKKSLCTLACSEVLNDLLNLTSPCGFFNTSKLAITLFAI
jgi:hypothetical protein